MPFERFGYLVLEQREMVCQHVVKKCRDSHFVASDYMKHLLYAVVVLLADIDLLAEPCRDIGTAYEYCVLFSLPCHSVFDDAENLIDEFVEVAAAYQYFVRRKRRGAEYRLAFCRRLLAEALTVR